MQKGRNLQYVAAGVQAMPGMRMNVRSNVRLPDSEVGSPYALEQQPFYAKEVAPARKRTVTVPLNSALIFLCALFVVFGVLALNKVAQKSELSKRITAMRDGIVQTEMDNIRLAMEVEEARDKARIGDLAVQQCGMMSSDSVTAVPVVAPNTRPFETQLTITTGDSPNPVQDHLKAGSR